MKQNNKNIGNFKKDSVEMLLLHLLAGAADIVQEETIIEEF